MWDDRTVGSRDETLIRPDALYGRDEELAALRTFLDRVGGRPVAATLQGDAGMGKTALFDAAVADAGARGWTTLVVRPAETEVTLSWVVLSDLLGSVLEGIRAALPTPQSRALDAVLLRIDATAIEPRLVATAAASAFHALAASNRLLVAIDDAQWVDPASAGALSFAFRRLPDRTAALVAERSAAARGAPLGLERALPPERLTRIEPGALSLAAIHHLVVRETGHAPGRPRLSEIARVSGGNPLYARELARWWGDSGGQPAGTHGKTSVPASLRDLVDARIRALDDADRDTVGVAALMAGPTASLLRASVEHDPRAALAAAEAAGILAVRDDRIQFSHPLLAEAAAAALPDDRRRAAHAGLARHATAIEDRGRHLAESASEPSAAIASMVEEAGQAMLARGAPSAAARLFTRAAALTPPDSVSDLARRSTDAAAALLAAGDVLRADDVVAVARGHADRSMDEERRVSATIVSAEVAWVRGDLRRARDFLVRTIESIDGSEARARLHSRLAGYTLPLDAEEAARHAEIAAIALGPDGPPAPLAYLRISQFVAEVLSGRAPRTQLLERGLELERAAAETATLSSVPLIWFNAIDDADRARSRHEAEDAWYELRGEDGWRAERLGQRALTEFRAGDWPTALAMAQDACDRLELEELRPAWWTPFAWRSLIDAHLGRFARAEETLRPLVDGARAQENRQWLGLTLSVLGIVRFVSGDPARADAAFNEARAAHESIGHVEPIGDRSEPFHVEALIALGELERASLVLERLERRGAALPRPWTMLAIPRARALVAAATGEPDRALTILDASDPRLLARFPFDAAWTDLVRGQVLRRLHRKLDAAARLEEAIAAFERFGAEPWAARARTELKRVGLRRVGRDELTATERRIAELARTGLRNREIAAAAFVSEKTVEANLARIYRKLDIRSRAELATRFATSDRPPDEIEGTDPAET